MPRGGRGVDQTHVVYGDALIKRIVFMQKERGVSISTTHRPATTDGRESRDTAHQSPDPQKM